MSRYFLKSVHYVCLNDCRQEGCPGHEGKMQVDATSDMLAFYIDGKPEYYFDEHAFAAMLESYKDEPMEDAQPDELVYWGEGNCIGDSPTYRAVSVSTNTQPAPRPTPEPPTCPTCGAKMREYIYKGKRLYWERVCGHFLGQNAEVGDAPVATITDVLPGSFGQGATTGDAPIAQPQCDGYPDSFTREDDALLDELLQAAKGLEQALQDERDFDPETIYVVRAKRAALRAVIEKAEKATRPALPPAHNSGS